MVQIEVPSTPECQEGVPSSLMSERTNRTSQSVTFAPPTPDMPISEVLKALKIAAVKCDILKMDFTYFD